MILNKIVFVLSDFELFFLTCRILNQLFKLASDFDLKIIQHVKFCVYFFCRLPSFHMFIKTVRFANVWTYGVGSVNQIIL